MLDGGILRSHRRIEPPIAIEIRKDHSTVLCRPRKVRTSPFRSILKTSAAVQKDPVRLRVLCVQPATRDEKVQPSIVIQIHQSASPAIPLSTQVEKTRPGTTVLKLAVARIQEYIVSLVLQSGHHKVRKAVPIDVTEICTHAGDIPAIAVVSDASFNTHFLK